MKTPILLFTVLIAMLFFVATTNARPNTSKSRLAFDEDGEAEIGFEERDTGRGRRTRHSRQTFNGYSSHIRSQLFEDRTLLYLDKILFELKEISENLNRPSSSPPVQPSPTFFMIPYPCHSCPSKSENTSLTSRDPFSVGPIWGTGDNKEDTANEDEDDDGSRPISFKPASVKLPAPPVEHGSVQAEKTTPRPSSPQPSTCEAAVIYCCRYEEPQRKECFESLKCLKTYKTGKACLPEVINYVIKKFVEAYVPR